MTKQLTMYQNVGILYHVWYTGGETSGFWLVLGGLCNDAAIGQELVVLRWSSCWS